MESCKLLFKQKEGTLSLIASKSCNFFKIQNQNQFVLISKKLQTLFMFVDMLFSFAMMAQDSDVNKLSKNFHYFLSMIYYKTEELLANTSLPETAKLNIEIV